MFIWKGWYRRDFKKLQLECNVKNCITFLSKTTNSINFHSIANLFLLEGEIEKKQHLTSTFPSFNSQLYIILSSTDANIRSERQQCRIVVSTVPLASKGHIVFNVRLWPKWCPLWPWLDIVWQSVYLMG